MKTPVRFGVDFDNTIVTCDPLFRASAGRLGIRVPSEHTTKTGLRNYVRSLPGGEIYWQKIQADVYGPGMKNARLTDGFSAFVERCRKRTIPVFIVSHKTETAAQNPEINLRACALSWMEAAGFFDRFGFSRSHIFFESTRQDKILRIAELGCTHFVDDLPEVLTHSDFPGDTVRILFSPGPRSGTPAGIMACSSWQTVSNLLFAQT